MGAGGGGQGKRCRERMLECYISPGGGITPAAKNNYMSLHIIFRTLQRIPVSVNHVGLIG